ncbi:hypothetical protein HMPREF0591_1749, partial [Mycobacterium parascrofulaceum ATCC BAA-614]
QHRRVAHQGGGSPGGGGGGLGAVTGLGDLQRCQGVNACVVKRTNFSHQISSLSCEAANQSAALDMGQRSPAAATNGLRPDADQSATRQAEPG